MEFTKGTILCRSGIGQFIEGESGGWPYKFATYGGKADAQVAAKSVSQKDALVLFAPGGPTSEGEVTTVEAMLEKEKLAMGGTFWGMQPIVEKKGVKTLKFLDA